MADFLDVKPGDPITADIWNRLLRSTDRSNILYGGENIRVAHLPQGTLINAKHVGGFLHPWRVLVSTQTISVYPGLINGSKPKMLDANTGQDQELTNRPPPLLQLNNNTFKSDGTGWVALELTTDKGYKDIKKVIVKQCQMITEAERTTNNPFFYFGLPGIEGVNSYKVRYPLARLQRVGEGQVLVTQVAMFNLNWVAKPPPPPGGAGTKGTTIGSAFPRHFFWPA